MFSSILIQRKAHQINLSHHILKILKSRKQQKYVILITFSMHSSDSNWKMIFLRMYKKAFYFILLIVRRINHREIILLKGNILRSNHFDLCFAKGIHLLVGGFRWSISKSFNANQSHFKCQYRSVHCQKTNKFSN